MKFHNKRVSLLSDPSMITMLTNDFGYDKAYEKFLEYYVEKDTLVIIMSSGGESKNMLNCVDWCEYNKVDYGVLTGFKSDNTIRSEAQNALWNYHIDSDDYGVVECVHQIFFTWSSMKYCFDLDGTICDTPLRPDDNKFSGYLESTPFPFMVEQVNRLFDEGHKIIIMTARGRGSGIDWTGSYNRTVR